MYEPGEKQASGPILRPQYICAGCARKHRRLAERRVKWACIVIASDGQQLQQQQLHLYLRVTSCNELSEPTEASPTGRRVDER